MFSVFSVINYICFLALAGSKTSPATADGGAAEPETGTAAGRKRRWGSSTAVTAKKPSISITTDSLKVLTLHNQSGKQAVFVVWSYSLCCRPRWK